MYVSTIFDGKNGLYYDPVGDELFVARLVRIAYISSLRCNAPVYELDFGDAKVVGLVKDHGYHEYLGDV
jgi:hypothetical protein